MWEWLRYLSRWIDDLWLVRWYSARWKHLWSFADWPRPSSLFSVNRTPHNRFRCSEWTHLWFWLRLRQRAIDLAAEARHFCFFPKGVSSLGQTYLCVAWFSHTGHGNLIEKCRDLWIRSSGEWVTRRALEPCNLRLVQQGLNCSVNAADLALVTHPEHFLSNHRHPSYHHRCIICA